MGYLYRWRNSVICFSYVIVKFNTDLIDKENVIFIYELTLHILEQDGKKITNIMSTLF